ncbi:MAG: hypothetical protein HXS41_07770 [Theionarchaea archaeon]|nr:hypothetical protein [Theionarchaea archaeon]MBU7041049.1 hypothetical protein [Theionarchaea archaeon]
MIEVREKVQGLQGWLYMAPCCRERYTISRRDSEAALDRGTAVLLLC